ncbi:MAG: TetR family transcriptional regulator [Gammaproteobacteria bacterium]|nr:TetR family transcriptional regulator [Gammaproteobacteria bacterium]
MARKTAEDSEKTRQLLIEKAGEVFYQKGVSRTTLQDVAEAAGMSRGAIYWRFKDKDELFEAFVNDVASPFEKVIENLLKNDAFNAYDKLRQFMLTGLLIPAKNENIMRAITVLAHRCEYTDEFRAGQTQMDKFDQEYFGLVMTLVEEAQQQQLLKNEQTPRVITFAIVAFMDGILDSWTYDKSLAGFELVDEAENLVDLFLGGLMQPVK